jgi:hypothetical protein
MWEVDELIKNSRTYVLGLKIDNDLKRNLIWNLEQIPSRYQFDAGGFEYLENENARFYKELSPFQVGLVIIQNAETSNPLIYDWSAFLLNFWKEYFPGKLVPELIKEEYFKEIRGKFNLCDFSNYEPIHRTLTIYTERNSWFSEEQNQLIDWFNE